MDSNFCSKCGASLEQNNIFCVNCGTKSNLKVNSSNEHYATTPKKKSSKKKKIGIVFGVIILLFFVLASISGNSSDTSSTTLPKLTSEEIKNRAITVTFDELMRNNEDYVDQIVFLEGKVIQADNRSGDKYFLRVSITPNSYGYSDPVFIKYEGTRILEDDVVQVYGEVKGIYEYTAILGNSIELPEINSLILDIVD